MAVSKFNKTYTWIFDQFLKLCPSKSDYNSRILAEFRDKKNILVHRFAPRNYIPEKHNQFD